MDSNRIVVKGGVVRWISSNKSKIESAIEETIAQHREFLEQIVEHAEECGK